MVSLKKPQDTRERQELKHHKCLGRSTAAEMKQDVGRALHANARRDGPSRSQPCAAGEQGHCTAHSCEHRCTCQVEADPNAKKGHQWCSKQTIEDVVLADRRLADRKEIVASVKGVQSALEGEGAPPVGPDGAVEIRVVHIAQVGLRGPPDRSCKDKSHPKKEQPGPPSEATG